VLRPGSDGAVGLGLARGGVDFISVLAAVEAEPASTVTAARSASTAAPREATSLRLGLLGEVDFISVLAAVEAGPASPVTAARSASTAAPRTEGEGGVARKPKGINPCRFTSKSFVFNSARRWCL
jgi:hypothetical protein